MADASVVAKWVLPAEPYQENAYKLRDNYLSKKVNLYAPAIITTEVANALWIAAKLRRLPKEESQSALKALMDMNITLVELDWTQMSQVLNISCELDLTVNA